MRLLSLVRLCGDFGCGARLGRAEDSRRICARGTYRTAKSGPVGLCGVHKPRSTLCLADLGVKLKRRDIAALGAGLLLAPRTAATQAAPNGLRVFPPKAAPFDERGRRRLAEDALLYLWEVHGDRPGRPVFSLPRAAILGTLEGIYLPR